MEKSTADLINSFSLTSLLQIIQMEEKTQSLKISSNGHLGYLHFKDGALINAETGEQQGQDAAIKILCWDRVEIEPQELLKSDQTISASLINILFEASRVHDEKRSSPEAILKQGIQKAEGHNFKEAQSYLAKYLRLNPNSWQGWLWYSRVVGSLKSIASALRKAIKLAPGEEEVVAEIKKFNLAKKHVTQRWLRRCAFCWAPLDIKTQCCHCCKGVLSIDARTFPFAPEADSNVISEAMERYTAVLNREENVSAHFYLGISHLNLEHWEQALDQFHKTVELAPEVGMFGRQLKILLDRMASSNLILKKEQTTGSIEAQAAPSAEPEAKTKRVMVVEDSPTTRKVITLTLSQNGYLVTEAKDGLEALSRLNEHKHHLILLDLILPKMDGYQILSIIKSNPEFREIPVIMLTSKDGFINKVKGKMAGSAAYLTKPFEPKKLLDTIERYL